MLENYLQDNHGSKAAIYIYPINIYPIGNCYENIIKLPSKHFWLIK